MNYITAGVLFFGLGNLIFPNFNKLNDKDILLGVNKSRVLNINFDDETKIKTLNGINNKSYNLNQGDFDIDEINSLNKYTVSFLFNWDGKDDLFVPMNLFDNCKLVFNNKHLGFDFNNNYFYEANQQLSKYKTYLVTLTIDKSNNSLSSIYIDGKIQKLNIRNNNEFKFKSQQSFSLGFSGVSIKGNSVIDDLNVYNRVLNDKEIEAIYKEMKTPTLMCSYLNNRLNLSWSSYLLSLNENANNNDFLIPYDSNYINIVKNNNCKVKLYRNDKKIYEGYSSSFRDEEAKDFKAPSEVADLHVDVDKKNITFNKALKEGTNYEYKLTLSNSDIASKVRKITLNDGIKGYSYVIDKNPDTVPGNDVNLDYKETSINIPELNDGIYYVHIKTIGNNGLSSQTTTKKFIIQKSTAQISDFMAYNNSKYGFDVQFKVSDNFNVSKVKIKAYRSGNDNLNKYGNIYTKEFDVNSQSDIIKQHINIVDIGIGAKYANVEIEAINEAGKSVSLLKEVKLDCTKPFISLLGSSNFSNPTKYSDFKNQENIKFNISDSYYDLESVSVIFDDVEIKHEDIYSKPKIAVLGKDDDLVNVLKKNNYDFKLIDEKEIKSIDELKKYDILLCKKSDGDFSKETANLLNNAYKRGAKILTINNDSTDSIHPIKEYTNGSGYDEYNRPIKLKQYSNSQKIRSDINSIDSIFKYIDINYDKDSVKTHISKLAEDTRPLICGETHTFDNEVYEPKDIEATYSVNNNKGEWIHYNFCDINEVALRRSFDNLMIGHKGVEEYKLNVDVNKNGVLKVKAVDMFGNEKEKTFKVRNIDDKEPVVRRFYYEEGNKTGYNYFQKETVKITANDSQSGIGEIKLPNGNLVKSSNVNYVVGNNGNYKFEIKDNAGNSIYRKANIKYIDNEKPTLNINANIDNNEWTNKDVCVDANAKDNIDTDLKIEYRINGGYWRRYLDKLDLTDDGEYNIEFRCVDSAGNSSDVVSRKYNIDRNAPTNNEISLIY
ncbi:hypothetical protein [Clostridium perfringens]|uniref:Uncharacterized protein n=1 Tax=Clostridium perfringens TaxID=1502 RepID=A0A140GR50_CLOPF|nr:hypothetical protein [Clostridium perfringens]AMN31009.1 hypothetical protein JFP838_pA0093 [Clostridium perfringens]